MTAIFPSGLFPNTVQKTAVLGGGAGAGDIGTVALFTVTGGVAIRLVCICTETLVGAATLEIGIAGTTTAFMAQVADATTIAAGDIYHDATVDAASELWSVTAVTAERILGNGQDIIATVGAANITDGTLVFTAFWIPLTPGASVVAA